MATPDESFNFVHELPSSFPGVDDDDWERAARLALAAMLVTAHRAGVHVSHARFLDLTDTFHRFRSLAVVRMRFDDHASICRWQVLAEVEL